jgi:glycosyltransferase involved in cell wall biosynthesis
MNPSEPRVSVVVPVYNSESTVGKCLNSLVEQDHPSFEVIVVDDGSTDKTAQICASYSQITVLSPGKVGPSRARNLGIDEAKGEFVAFTDADCIVNRDWLTELEKGFTGPDIAGVGGDQKSPED